MCRLGNIAMREYQERATTRQTQGQMDGRTDRRPTKWSLCATMLRRLHNKSSQTTMLALQHTSLKVFQKKVKLQGQGHMVNNSGTMGKVLSQGLHMCNMYSGKKVMAKVKVFVQSHMPMPTRTLAPLTFARLAYKFVEISLVVKRVHKSIFTAAIIK